jgi:hypothetical protein
LESLNAQIKKTGTLREQLSISVFFERALKIVKEWSTDRNPRIDEANEDAIVFREQAYFFKKDWEAAYGYKEKLFKIDDKYVFSLFLIIIIY